jgi:hypothetical protein
MGDITINSTNMKKKTKEGIHFFKQIENNKETSIILKSVNEGFISFNIKSKYKISVNDIIINNLYINLKNKVFIKCLTEKDNYIKIKNLTFFSEEEYKSFDFDNYRNNYCDLKELNNYMLWCHWCQYGKKEGRIFTKLTNLLENNDQLDNNNQLEKDFNWKQYINNYTDLINACIDTEKKAIEHWIYNGRKEGRTYYKYDINYFKNIYVNDIYNKKISLKNIVKIESDKEQDSIDESNILITKHYNKLDFNPEKIDIEYIKYIENLILIVDFFNGGGGTTHFINHMVSKYKINKIFLIVRNYTNKIIFTINDEYEINNEYDCESANNFIKEINNKIEKIFINHTLGHNILFLNELLKLNKEITTITHDFYLINDIPNPMIHNIKKNYTNINKLNINVFNNIITQNKKNLLIIQDHLINKNIPIIITDLPDYKEILNLVETSNNKIVIGIFGAISDIKGLHILKDIINFYKNNDLVEIVVFGLCNISDFKNQYIYHSINELNELLIKFKPNILMELSIWPETYSYTLSLKMITKLPIIYFKKTGNFVVEDRLSKYDKAYPFETLEEFDKLIKLHKQNYFYTIKPVIYFNDFWDEYFNYVNEKNIVIINSKLITSNFTLSYVNKRSIYTFEERLEQTKQTIETIRKYIPCSYIVFFDNSILDDKYKIFINNNVDKFINITYDEKCNYYTNECEYKAYGELSQLYLLFKELKINFNIKNIFKISGRYKINEKFKYFIYNNNNNIFKLNEDVKDRLYYYTSFYKINNINEFIDVIKTLFLEIQTCKKYDNIDLEVLLPIKFSNIKLIPELGITENIGVWKQIKDI